MPNVIFQKWISRVDLKANPNVLYVFGDNMERAGLGGQAKEMRGEHNAIGIATKWAPNMNEDAFFKDSDFDIVKDQIDLDFTRLEDHDGVVVIPLDGLGTGLSELPIRAPKIYAYINQKIRNLMK